MPISEQKINLCLHCQEPPDAHHPTGRCLFAPTTLEIHVCAGCKQPFEYTGGRSTYGGTIPMHRGDFHVGCTSDVLKEFSARGHPMIKGT